MLKKSRAFILVAAVGFAPLVVGCATSGGNASQTGTRQATDVSSSAPDVAMPPETRMVPPGDAVPDEIRRFHGRWEGDWENKLDTVLLIEQVQPTGEAIVVYAYGDYSGWGITRSWTRVKGTIQGDTLTLARFPNSAQAKFSYQADGTLDGVYERNGRITYGEFEKASGA